MQIRKGEAVGMNNNVNITHEELMELLEKAKREAQERLDKMTPEERQKAEEKAKARIEEDRKSMQELIDAASRAAASSEDKPRPKFCTNCGAPDSGGRFCSNCGSPLT